jgi:hypothetical protein
LYCRIFQVNLLDSPNNQETPIFVAVAGETFKKENENISNKKLARSLRIQTP